MRIIYVTANLPHGEDEAFLLPEIGCLIRLGHDVLVVPRSPSGDVLHGAALLDISKRETLWSGNVAQAAIATCITRFGKLAYAVDLLRESPSLRAKAKNLAVLPKAAWLAKLAADWAADHIHCHWAGTTATMAMAASELSGVPWSLTLHRWDIVENNLLARKVRSASLVRFISEDGLRMGLELGIPSGAHVRVVHMGVQIPPARTRPRSDRRIVLCPARLVEVKGHRFLLEAWRILRDQGICAELWLAGGGPLRDRLALLAASLGVKNSVRFLGAVPHNKLLEMYEQFDVAAVVLPSVDLGGGYHEGIPVALIEAMSYGIPVIGTQTGGTSELIQGGTGVMVRPGDAAQLAAAMRSVMSNPEGARRLGEYGRRHVAQEFDIRRTVSELAGSFEAARHTARPLVAAFAASGTI
jgi:glycosyltransferase involved in cell wall biosynthesis